MDPNREIELKLELTPGDAARVLEHPVILSAAVGPAEVEHLHSVYFDSRDLALAREGMALRLRRSGGKQIQTVKFGDSSAAGLFSRGEVEVEVSGERPDPEAIPDEAVRARLLDVLAGQPLEPIFETEMKRTHQRLCNSSAEWSVDLDEGEVRAGFAREVICELELELHSGPVSQLYDVALALSDSVPLWPGTRSKAERGHALRTGTPTPPVHARLPELPRDATLRDAMQPIALSCLAQISGNAAPAWEGIDPEGVHQMRVGVRRMRSFFTLLRPALPSNRLSRLRDSLRWLAALLGEVRDLDVFIDARVRPHVPPSEDGVAMGLLLERAVAMREQRRLLLRKALRSRRYARLILELGRWAARSDDQDPTDTERSTPLQQPALGFAEVALTRLHRKAEKLAGPAIAGSPAARHGLRIALKKLRYACEFFQSPFGPKEARRYLRRLSRLQDLLGALNDLETARSILQQLLDHCEPEHAVDLARAAGFVEGFAAGEDERVLRKLSDRWERFEDTRPFWTRREST